MSRIHVLVRSAVLGLVCCIATPAASSADDFGLRDGDTVVFLGDSITAARIYSRIVENYTLLRFPDRRVRFINRGHGGETAAGAVDRLDRDVFANHATVLIIAYGVNDIGWGVYADEEHKQRYLQGIAPSCALSLRRSGLHLFGGLRRRRTEEFWGCATRMAALRELGEHSIDVQRTMRSIQQRIWDHNARLDDESRHVSLHAADGVHLNDLGQLAMAYAILKGLDAPADVSSAAVHFETGEVEAAENCRISDVVRHEDRLEFTRLDSGLPFNNGLFYALNYAWVPVPSDLARYMLTVSGLPERRYDVSANGRGIGTYTARQLADGVNVAFATTNAWEPGGPWDAQASTLALVTESKDNTQTAAYLRRHYNQEVPDDPRFLMETAEAVQALETLQRTIAGPRPYRFVIAPAAEKSAPP